MTCRDAAGINEETESFAGERERREGREAETRIEGGCLGRVPEAVTGEEKGRNT